MHGGPHSIIAQIVIPCAIETGVYHRPLLFVRWIYPSRSFQITSPAGADGITDTQMKAEAITALVLATQKWAK